LTLKNKFLYIFILFSFMILPSQGIPKVKAYPEKKRPKIGVVLSGGGAKGFAHIALLEKLEELHIPVDYIGGTSMGATVAALYSMGYTISDLKRIARNTEWMSYFSNEVQRRDRGVAIKDLKDRYPLSLSLGMNGISLPTGLVNGHHISSFLSRLTWGAHDIKDFRKMPIPFLCVATDMETGKARVFKDGSLKEALRASMAIPSIFDPVEIDGHIYQDGGIVNNFPVKELKNVGADIVIGVDVGAPLYKKEQLNSIARILEQTTSFLGERKTVEQRKICDILILPDMSRYDSTSFEHTDDIIHEGEKAVLTRLKDLKSLSEKLRKYGSTERLSIVVPDRKKSISIDEIRFHGLSKKSLKVVRKTFPLKRGEIVTVDKIDRAINYVYGSGAFEKISYSINNEKSRTILNLYFSEKPQTSLSLGFTFDNETMGAILLNYTVNNIGLQNSLISLNARVGEFSKLEGTYFLYTPFKPGIGIGLKGKTYNIKIYMYEDGKKTESYDMKFYSGSTFVGAIISNSVFFTTGIEQEFYYFNSDIGGDPDYKFDTMKYFADLKIDTLDDCYYPTGGIFFEGRFEYVRPDISFYDGDRYYSNFKRYVSNMRVAIPLPGPLTFIAGASFSLCEIENVPPPYWYSMGGYQHYEVWGFPLYGYNYMEVVGQHGFVYSTSLQWRVFRDFYLLFRWNQGKISNDYRKLFEEKENFYGGYGVTVGYKTFFGPLEGSIFKKYGSSDYTYHINLGIQY